MQVTKKEVLEAMTYSDLIEESFKVRGVNVDIRSDQFPENPYHFSDCMAPALWHAFGQTTEYGDSDLENPIWNMSPQFVSRNYRRIESILDNVDPAEPKAIQQEWGGDLSDIRQEYYAECLSELRGATWGVVCDYFEALAELWRLQGIAADTFQSNGYSQGDSARGLIVHMPEWVERVGFNGDAAKDMESEARVYGAWGWGDVYIICVEGGICCGGFYGFDAEGAAEFITEEVNAILEDKATAVAEAMQSARPDLYAIA